MLLCVGAGAEWDVGAGSGSGGSGMEEGSGRWGGGGDPQGPETHVAVALRLFVRGTACLVRELGAIPSC